MINREEASAQLKNITTTQDLNTRYQNFLGKRGKLTEALKSLATLSPEEKKKQGSKLSQARNKLQAAYTKKVNTLEAEAINAQLGKEVLEYGLPGVELQEGHFSLLTKVRRELEEIAYNMGFIIESGTDIVSKFENFEAVNIPVSHPATEMHDTIYVDEKDERGENYVLRTHTSAAQNYVMKKY